jgi:Bax protein
MISPTRLFAAIPNERSRRCLAFVLAVPATVAAATILTIAAWSPRMPDFRDYVAGPARKAEFFAFLGPLIEEENARVLEDRRALEALAEDSELGWLERHRLRALAEKYRLDTEGMDERAVVDALLRRADVVPESLALAQAAKESGWGTSRFARQGYSLFGERCFQAGCGITPEDRDAGLSHEVESFRSPRRSVASYVRNINTHRRYRSFRAARAQLRAAGKRLSGMVLAEQLPAYSERRRAYVEEIKQLIAANGLDASAAVPGAAEAGNSR